MKCKIHIDTMDEAANLVTLIKNLRLPDSCGVTITDNKGMRVNARSLLGVLYSMEFVELWLECDLDIYTKLNDFLLEE